MAVHNNNNNNLDLSRNDKLRSSFFLPDCCFHQSSIAKLKLLRTSSNLKIKCGDLISRIGNRQNRRRSADFQYDALSYAMNFEDDSVFDDDRYYVDSFIRRDFSARLAVAAAPSSSSAPVTPREVAPLSC